MLRLNSSEVYNPIFIKNIKKNKFQLFTGTFDEFSIEELKDELEEILNTADNTPPQLQHEKTGPRTIEAYRKLGSEKSSTDSYMILSMGYAKSPFRDFESYLRIVVGLD